MDEGYMGNKTSKLDSPLAWVLKNFDKLYPPPPAVKEDFGYPIT